MPDEESKVRASMVEILTSREAMSINFTAYISIEGKVVYPTIAAELTSVPAKRGIWLIDFLGENVGGAYNIETDTFGSRKINISVQEDGEQLLFTKPRTLGRTE